MYNLKFNMTNTTPNAINTTPKDFHRIKCIHGIPTIRNINIEAVKQQPELETFLIEFRILPHLEFIIKNTIIKLPNWKHSIVCGNINYEFIKKISTSICELNDTSNAINIIKLDISNLSTSEYSQLLLTTDFWNNFKGEKLLLYQEDTYLFHSNNIERFLEYDYIGASWPINQDDNINGVGNGGFSLRSKSKMIECINKVDPFNDLKLGASTINYMRASNNNFIPEDVFFSKSMLDFKIGKVATRNIANQFSQETQSCYNPIGGHNFWLANNNKTFFTNLVLETEYYKMVKHRGGWKSVIQNLITNKLVITNITPNSIKFVDCIESRFSSWSGNNTLMSENWVGMFHYSPDLPVFIKDDLSYIANNNNVVRSLAYCKGIIVLSNNSLNKLRQNPIYKNIKTIALKHPIESIDIKFTMDKFMANTNKCLIQLGLQDRITSTIYMINSKYNKLWLPSRDTALNYLKHEAHVLNIVPQITEILISNKVDIKYIENHADFDNMLQTNIVIIPLFGASANNSVLEIIEMNIPAFVSRLPATEEYLGKEYPLFYNNISEVETIINDDDKLLSKINEGYKYLSNMDKTQFSYDYFNRELYKFYSSV
jgi:hypothetical protein